MQRSSGILMHISSLPSPYGIGTLGKAAYEFADFLKAAGQTYWQVLPLTPTGYGDSPYSSFSTFAGNPFLIDLDMLIEDGLLKREEVLAIPFGTDPEHVDYKAMTEHRYPLLRKAYERGFVRDAVPVSEWTAKTPWAEDYAFYMALRAHFEGKAWPEWPEDIRLRRPEAMAQYKELLRQEVQFHLYLQYLFFSQWEKLHTYVTSLGIHFIGDIPFYMTMDSADAWREPQFFLLDSDFRPTHVAGVPPDYFSEDGQLWGNPLYDWDAMKADGYGWWIRRMEAAHKLFDVVRLDHFRAFESYWAIPADSTTAKTGEWRKGPGMDVLRVLRDWFYGLSYIAEDLGILTPEVEQLREESGFPGMNILEFAFNAQGSSKYEPHRLQKNSVCYTGTHDNNTVLGWWEDPDVPAGDKQFAKDYLGLNEEEGICLGFLRGGLSSPSNLFVAQMQDWLGLPGECRMNRPGVAEGNWTWRMKPGAATEKLADRILQYTRMFDR